MKHSVKITLLLLLMFFVAQLIGIFVLIKYSPETIFSISPTGELSNSTTYNLPFGMDPPPEVEERSIGSIVISFAIVFSIAVLAMLFLMKFNAAILIRTWFFIVASLAIGISFNSLILSIPNSSLLALVVAIPLAFFKIFKRNIIVHNLTELLIYPGIAAIFVALILSWTSAPILVVSAILVLISLYDMYAVWHSGFMQKMAKYQIQNLKLFTGFFVPYLGKKELKSISKKKSNKKNVKVSVAILGGGDVVFPIILSGAVLFTLGLIPALIISLGATAALATLFWFSEKGKFYPAMPFISAGCFIALGIAYLI